MGGRPGTGNPPTISLDLRRQAGPGPPASSRPLDRMDDQPSDRLHLVRSEPARIVVAGVPTRIPEATFGGIVSSGIAFLLTVMPDLVEEVLGFVGQ